MLNKTVGAILVAAFASFCLANLCRAQGVSQAVEIPTSRNGLVDVSWTADSNINVATEFKSTTNVVEQEKPAFWNWYTEFGYETEYNFRGTNLTPDADGALFLDMEVSKWGLTLGLYDVYQLGTAHAASFSIGEGGGGGTLGRDFAVGTFTPETVQTFFNEIDLFLQYHRDFGPIEVTAGNIAFFIERDAQTFLETEFFNQFFGPSNPFPTVQNEQFDRVFIRISTSVIPHIQPWITYYQTLLSQGEDHQFYEAPSGAHFGSRLNDNFHERNDELGGYLEGRIRGNFPISAWIDVNPFFVISYSFHDRSEPVISASSTSDHRLQFADTIRGRSLVGWNHAQVGLELPIHVLHFAGSSSEHWAPPDVRVNLIPFGDYSYHISTPTAGTDRNEWWGGAKLAVTF